MNFKARLNKLESVGSAYVGVAERLNAVQAKRKAGHIQLLKSEDELNIIIASSSNKLQVRLAKIYLRRFRLEY